MDISKLVKHRKLKNQILVAGLTLGLSAAFSVQAELKVMNDSAMADVTGQAGLTAEFSVEVSLAELAYQDEGFLTIEEFKWGGADRTGSTGVTGAFDNWKMVVDVAGESESLAYGFSELDLFYSDVSSPDAAWNSALLANDDEQISGDGDLVIHITSTQLFDGTRYDSATDSDVELTGGLTTQPSDSFTDTMDDWRNSAAFGLEIGAVKLQKSSYEVGSKLGGTTLISNFRAEVLTGPLDIIIKNGNGFTDGVSDSKILISDYFEITDLSMDVDFLGISISGLKLHNRRGDTTGLNTNSGLDGIAGNADDVAVESFGFAHAKWNIAGLEDKSQGLQIAGAIKGDMDISSISIGNTSIGSLYLTDMTVQASLNVRGR
jgi:uncharacterized protein DUF6160